MMYIDINTNNYNRTKSDILNTHCTHYNLTDNKIDQKWNAEAANKTSFSNFTTYPPIYQTHNSNIFFYWILIQIF